MEPPATLRPLAGEPADLQRLLAGWITRERPAPLTVRTSGSTGEPKEVLLSAAAVTASATATLARLGGPGQWVLALPTRYVAGLQVVVRSLLAGTTPVVLAEHPSLDAAARSLTHPRRYLALVPTQLYRMLASTTEMAALAGFDAVLLGGGAADADLLDRARDCGVAVVTTYGMSETCGGCVYDGRPLDGVEVALGPRDRVIISGPVLFDGYVDQPELTAEALQGGRLNTPDVGRVDPTTGRLEILGRLDDVVVSGGANVALSAVERRVREHPSVAEAAVVGVPDAEWGTRVVAFVVAVPGVVPPSVAELRDFVAEVHPRGWSPRELVVESMLPMLESGKPDRQALVRTMASLHG